MSMSMPEPWWRGAVICQVYPRSFRDTKGDGIGDLPDITEKLDHIARLAVDRNSADPDSVLSTVRRVLAWRRQHPAMVGGEFFMADTREPVFAFERRSGGERIFCAFNLTNRPATSPVPGGLRPIEGNGTAAALENRTLSLPPFGVFFAEATD